MWVQLLDTQITLRKYGLIFFFFQTLQNFMSLSNLQAFHLQDEDSIYFPLEGSVNLLLQNIDIFEWKQLQGQRNDEVDLSNQWFIVLFCVPVSVFTGYAVWRSDGFLQELVRMRLIFNSQRSKDEAFKSFCIWIRPL